MTNTYRDKRNQDTHRHRATSIAILLFFGCILSMQLGAQTITTAKRPAKLQQLYKEIKLSTSRIKQQAYQPVIGISTCHSTSHDIGVRDNYINAVIKAGGIPVLIPLTDNARLIYQLLSHVDGVILTGGSDIDTSYFGEEPIAQMGKVDSLRDVYDMILIKLASDRRMPMLGICRGEQLINVAFGGTLYQDLPTQQPSNIIHKQKEPSSVGTHHITLTAKSRLCHILCDSLNYKVNSFHHQAVKQVAPGFKATAFADDHIVEAFESNATQNIIAVQFHPEGLILNGDHTMLHIFQDLVKRAKLYHKTNGQKRGK